MLKTSSRVVMSTKVCNGAEHMALESSARVAVTHAIENKDDLGQMLGKPTTAPYAHVLHPAFTCGAISRLTPVIPTSFFHGMAPGMAWHTQEGVCRESLQQHH